MPHSSPLQLAVAGMLAPVAAFAFGQILGPLLVSAVASRTWGMELSLATASLLLALSATALHRR